MAVGEVVPELDGLFAEDVNLHTAAREITFVEIRKSGWKGSDFTKASEQVLLFAPFERPKKFQNLDVNEQTGVAHLDSSVRPSLRSHSSAVSQWSGDWSSIFCASLDA